MLPGCGWRPACQLQARGWHLVLGSGRGRCYCPRLRLTTPRKDIMTIINMNLTEYMAPADRLPSVKAYAEAVEVGLEIGTITGPLTTRCPECDSDFADLDEAYEDTEHIIIATTSDTTAVVVACEEHTSELQSHCYISYA